MEPEATNVAPFQRSRLESVSNNPVDHGNDLLTVNTSQLNIEIKNILSQVSHVKNECMRIGCIEEEQTHIRKALRLLELKTESNEKILSFASHEVSEEMLSTNLKNDTIATTKATATNQQLFSVDDDNSDIFMEQLRNNRKELIGLRTIVKQLQNSQDEDATHFLDADHRHQVLKTDLMILRKELSSSLTKEHLDKLYHSLATNQSKILSSVKEEQNRFTRTIDGRVGEDLKKLSSWFTEHDLLATKRQANLDKKFSSYARANELAELKENLESDGEILTSKVVKATKMLKKALFDIGNSDQKKTMQNLNRRVLGFFKQLLLMGFKTWYKFSEKTVEYQKRQQLQYSCMMKMAAKQVSVRSERALRKTRILAMYPAKWLHAYGYIHY